MPCLQQRKTPLRVDVLHALPSLDAWCRGSRRRRRARCRRCCRGRRCRRSARPSPRIIAATCASSATSTAKAQRLAAAERGGLLRAAVPSMSAAQTCAPSALKRIAASRPMPPPAPVITHTFPSRRPIAPPFLTLAREEDVLDLGVAGHRLHAELAAEARLLEAAERRRRPHRAVRVDREHARSRARARRGSRVRRRASRSSPRARRACRSRSAPRRPRRSNGITAATGPEDLLARDPVVVGGLDERAGIPEAGAVGDVAAEERLALDEGRDALAVARRRSAGPSRSPRARGRRPSTSRVASTSRSRKRS